MIALSSSIAMLPVRSISTNGNLATILNGHNDYDSPIDKDKEWEKLNTSRLASKNTKLNKESETRRVELINDNNNSHSHYKNQKRN